MTEEAKMVSAILSAVFALAGIFVFSIILEPLALVTGIIGATSKKMGICATGIVGAALGFILFIYTIIVFAQAAEVLQMLQ